MATPEGRKKSLVLYGDSVGCSYRMNVRLNSYCNLLSRRLGMDYLPDYITGANSTAVLQLLSTDEEKVADIAKSEIVCLSVGGNNVLVPFLLAMIRALDLGPLGARTIPGINDKFKNDKLAIPKVIKELLSKQTKNEAAAGVATFKEEFPLILDKIKETNPDAVIIVQTVYNPFNTTQSKASREVGKPMGKFMDQLNEIIFSFLEKYNLVIADIEKVFKDYRGDGDITHIKERDMHLTDFGHSLVYQTMYSELVKRFPKYECPESPDLYKTRLTMTAEERAEQDDADAKTAAQMGTKNADASFVQPQDFSAGPLMEYNSWFTAEANGMKYYPLKKATVTPAEDIGMKVQDTVIIKLVDGIVTGYSINGTCLGAVEGEIADDSGMTLKFACEQKFQITGKVLSVGDKLEILYAIYPTFDYYAKTAKEAEEKKKATQTANA